MGGPIFHSDVQGGGGGGGGGGGDESDVVFAGALKKGDGFYLSFYQGKG